MSARSMPGLTYRLAVAGRVVLASVGGYGVAALSAALLALILPMPRSEAVSTGTLASFAIMAGAVIWVFAARTLLHAALVLGLIAVLLGTGLWLAGAFTTAMAP
ncbi:iron transporter [Methylobacterium sp. J-048]|uniref:iron transporter n=1 Tax=Methylobacterium sp. J-048 TaxID=2836635 RepID=UPI001FB9179A|nr:iron transporter [Methylobacterium sp. J-048]MCJ2060728.1 iron transporter [Methylobacterium sp. J-048]